MSDTDYLIKLKAGKTERAMLWQGAEAIDLDMHDRWIAVEQDGQLHCIDRGPIGRVRGEHDLNHRAASVVIEPPLIGESAKVSLDLGTEQPLEVEFTRLKRPPPVYEALPAASTFNIKEPTQLCVFYGQGPILVRYRPIGFHHILTLGETKAFEVHGENQRYTITSMTPGLTVAIDDQATRLNDGDSIELNAFDFFKARFSASAHWWRFGLVPTPDALPPLETDESEDDLREIDRLRKSMLVFLTMTSAMIMLGYILQRLAPPPEKPAIEVVIKQPKFIPPPPPPPEAKKIPPKPTPIPKPLATPAPLPPPKKAEPPKPKPAPKKPAPPKAPPKEKPKAVAKPPPPKVEKVVSKPRPRIKPQATQPEPPPVKKEPDPAQIAAAQAAQAAAQRAKEKAAQEAQVAKALGFLSSSAKRPAADPIDYEVNKKAKFGNTAVVGGTVSKGDVLDKLAKNAPGDGSIQTKSGRGTKSDINFKDAKSLNDVQGKVSLTHLYSESGEPGAGLTGGKGLELTGPGEISEALIEKALAKFLNRFQYCYEKALLTDASLGGNIVVQWNITTAGRAAESKVVKSQLNNSDLHSCILKVLGDVPFPKPKGGSVQVKKTFAFSSASI